MENGLKLSSLIPPIDFAESMAGEPIHGGDFHGSISLGLKPEYDLSDETLPVAVAVDDGSFSASDGRLAPRASPSAAR